MKRVVFWALAALTMVLATGIFMERNALACEMLPMLRHQQLNDHVFVAHDVTSEQAGHLLGLVALASERISDVYGPPQSMPRILVTSDVATAARWGANDTASMLRLPWRGCIVVGPRGQNVDVLAHEWLHAEIQHRVGFFRLLRDVPTWFDEGAALTLDYRDPFLPQNIQLSDEQVDAVRALKGARAFFSGDVRVNYQAARMAVTPLIHQSTFYRDLDRLGAGERFEAVFLKSVEPAP